MSDSTAIAVITTDFNLDNEYKDEPLIPNGTYEANVTKVWYDADKNAIKWKVTLDGNEAVFSDGETPVDGATCIYNNWLPAAGDENIPSANGRSNKRQTKVNMLKKFADAMGINMNSSEAIMEALNNQEWHGLRVQVIIAIREYEGNFSNEVKSMKAI